MNLKSERITLLIVTVLISLLGLFFVFEASAIESYNMMGDTYYQFKKQLVGFFIGIVALLVISKIPTQFFIKMAWPLYIIGLAVTVLAFLPSFRSESNLLMGASRWIYIFGFSIQTVEIVKFCLIMFFAFILSRSLNLFAFTTFLAPPVLLILMQRDLGSLLVIGACLIGMYFVAGAKWKDMGILVGGALLLAILSIVLTPYRRERVLAFLQLRSGDTEITVEVDTWHVDQLLLGLGRGGAFGQGIGNSRQKYSFVPEPSTDSIFAIVGEEVGFVGCMVILLLYLFFLYLIFRIVTLSKLDKAQRLVGYGILILFASQIFLNIAAISSLTPLTGITLPFFSYGSSSLIMSLVFTGVILGLGTKESSTLVKKRQSRIIKK